MTKQWKTWSRLWKKEDKEELKLGRQARMGAREVLLQGSFYEVSLALVGVASLA